MADIKVLSPFKAIRAKCLDCSCYVAKEVRECRITSCALWPYRMGVRPSTIEKRRARQAVTAHE